MTKEILEIAEAIKRNDYELGKLKIFDYDTADEANPSTAHERSSRSDISIEIGGPSTHIKIYVITRAEHTIIKNAVEEILRGREMQLNARLYDFCTDKLRD